MAAPVDEKLNATKSSCDEEESFCLYAHQYWSGPNPTDVASAASTGLAWGFGRSDDWPLLDGPGPNAKVVGRVQGHHMLFFNNNYNAALTIVFQDDKFKGSTLQVRGLWVPESPFEWSILGGTGRFTLAQGIIYGKTLSINYDSERQMQLCFQVFYRPIVKPDMA